MNDSAVLHNCMEKLEAGHSLGLKVSDKSTPDRGLLEWKPTYCFQFVFKLPKTNLTIGNQFTHVFPEEKFERKLISWETFWFIYTTCKIGRKFLKKLY